MIRLVQWSKGHAFNNAMSSRDLLVGHFSLGQFVFVHERRTLTTAAKLNKSSEYGNPELIELN
jgi:hypothetical protein